MKRASFRRLELFALFVKWISRQPGRRRFFSKYGSLLPNLGSNFLRATDDR